MSYEKNETPTDYVQAVIQTAAKEQYGMVLSEEFSAFLAGTAMAAAADNIDALVAALVAERRKRGRGHIAAVAAWLREGIRP